MYATVTESRAMRNPDVFSTVLQFSPRNAVPFARIDIQSWGKGMARASDHHYCTGITADSTTPQLLTSF